MVEGLMLDIRLQYALHTTSCAEQPLSDKTLSRFRKRCYDYETLTGRDLYHECVGNLGGVIAKIMDVSGRSRRMDSMMIESNIRRLSRMELLYQFVSRMAVAANKKDKDFLPDALKHYTDPDDFNKVIYHQHGTDSEERRSSKMARHFSTFAKIHLPILLSMNSWSDASSNIPSSMTEREGSVQKKMARSLPHLSRVRQIRNAIETIPRNLRRDYHHDKLPRGKQRG